ncbi:MULTISPECIES: hypothetical protein [Lactobacillaceae]|uniref:hypothetical protein n=1 Tax=Lactobacillaceae TaxID=33958 RepID=UPI0008636EC8|nr:MULTISPECIES: hypothetical protein [Lactobacillaceae]MCT3035395.1 hypothetical protein [Pediococcus parvulus]
MKTFVISLSTSIIVSLFTFIIGLKTGKMQQDREKKQKLYQEMFVYFTEIRRRLKINQPLKWNSYKNVYQGGRDVWMTPLRKIFESGDIVILRIDIMKKCQDIEKDSFKLGSDLNYMYNEQIFQILAGLDTFFKERGRFKKNAFSKQRFYESVGSVKGKFVWRNYQFIDLLLKAPKSLFEVKKNGMPYRIDFEDANNPHEYGFTINGNALPDDKTEMLKYLSMKLDQLNLRGVYLKRKEKELEELDDIIDILRKKAKDPDSFWEIFVGAFMDIIKR